MDASLYVHVPFCAGICAYCDFYSVPVREGDSRVSRYLDRILEDGEELLRQYRPEKIPTVYIGGGTPSVLGARGIRRLLKGLAGLWAGLEPEKTPGEISLEANPESADAAFLEAARQGGVNRLSLGIQSFHEASRRAAGRIGEGSLLPERLETVSRFFPRAFSADLMSGLPFQDKAILDADIERLAAYEPAHISLYSLTVEDGTPLAETVKRDRRFPLPRGDEADRLWLDGRDRLESLGYCQYEVSNFCVPGKECRHNIRYWRMENWLALGPAASSTIVDEIDGKKGSGRRITLFPDIDRWLDRPRRAPPPGEEEYLPPLTLMKESILMGFRYIGGPDPGLFENRFRVPLERAIPRTLSRWREQGLLERDRTALTKEGLLFLNPFLAEAFEEIEQNKNTFYTFDHEQKRNPERHGKKGEINL